MSMNLILKCGDSIWSGRTEDSYCEQADKALSKSWTIGLKISGCLLHRLNNLNLEMFGRMGCRMG